MTNEELLQIEHTLLSAEDNVIATYYVVEPNEDNSHEENDSETLKNSTKLLTS